MVSAQKVSEIINNVTGKNVEDRRIDALRSSGFSVSFEGVKWNWGRSGKTEQDGESVIAQLKCATGGKGKNGYSVNRCEVYRVK
jgi:hypothetical protein